MRSENQTLNDIIRVTVTRSQFGTGAGRDAPNAGSGGSETGVRLKGPFEGLPTFAAMRS